LFIKTYLNRFYDVFVMRMVFLSHVNILNVCVCVCVCVCVYQGADNVLARPTSRCILSDGENISFDASLVTCILYIVLIFLHFDDK
jgi:hypothetical protein